MNNVTKGNFGESLACNFLENKGYKIIERNFRIRGGEIDIIAKEGQTLVFVEVKTRSQNTFGTPEESVTYRKLKFLERAAKFYRANRRQIRLPDLERIDVVSVNLGSKEPSFKLIKNAGF